MSGGKSASARSKPNIQKMLENWLEKHSEVSREDWEKGHLWSKNLTEVPPFLPEGLKQLGLDCNQIQDVSGLRLPEGLQLLGLYGNQIPKEKRSQLKVPSGCHVSW